jgi:DmsE family decaheme c-type cytochrome
VLRAALPAVADAEFVNDDELCLTCHKTYTETFKENVHQGIPQSCEGCHGPASRHVSTRGKEPGLILGFKKLPPAEAAELCLKCHEENACAPGASWRTSVHAHHAVSCGDCHTSHYNVPPGTPATTEPGAEARTPNGTRATLASYQESAEPAVRPPLYGTSENLGAITPQICYRCHAGMQQYQQVAHSHQICGAAGFDCSTCHDPHGKIRQETRTDLCLQCHNGTPTMAWHSSVHSRLGVACTDCHNPHPDTGVQEVVNIRHTDVARPKRLPMSVNEPDACYRCHQNIYAMGTFPSHHPIYEGKMTCSDCHDPHGQAHGNLNANSLNQVCYRCHAEKQGPFVREHPPVTENCAICHEPHGTVANNLLRQPTTFLCLRCHTGHRKDNRNPDATWIAEQPDRANPTGFIIRAGHYADCSQCHTQVHGSDIGSNTGRGTFLR